jgi:Ras-related protein Rab-11A
MSKKSIQRTAIRISFLGDAGCGKTSIINRFIEDKFTDVHLTTIGLEKNEKKMKMKDGTQLKVILWDTAGQERFKTMTKTPIKASQGIVIVFDLTKKVTFENLDNWVKTIKENNNNAPIALFGNKSDMIEEIEINNEDAENYAKEKGMFYFETSAKENVNIKEGLDKIIEESYEKAEGEIGTQLKKGKNNKKKGKC